MLEAPDFLGSILEGEHGADCAIRPDDSPAGSVIRVIFDLDYFAVEHDAGAYQNTDPRVMARTQDVAEIEPEVTILLIEGRRYIAQRLEPVVGNNAWRAVMLRETA